MEKSEKMIMRALASEAEIKVTKKGPEIETSVKGDLSAVLFCLDMLLERVRVSVAEQAGAEKADKIMDDMWKRYKAKIGSNPVRDEIEKFAEMLRKETGAEVEIIEL